MTERRRRQHPARRARLAATALGVAGVIGLTGVLGLSAGPTPGAGPATAQAVVPPAVGPSVAASPAAPRPIKLKARQIVRTVTVPSSTRRPTVGVAAPAAAAPRVTTSGSQ